MSPCHYIAVFCLQVMLIIAAFGFPGELTGNEEEPMYASDEYNNKTTYIPNPENITNSANLTEIATVTSENVTDNRTSVEYSSEYENNNSTSVKSNNTLEYENENNDDAESATPQEYKEKGQNENNYEIESVTRHADVVYASDEKPDQEAAEAKIRQERQKIRPERQKMRKGFVDKCIYTRYVRIQDKYGCEMCTCIYEKAMMLCSPFKCKDHGLLATEMDPITYNDYVLGVETHFSEYKCDPGQVIETGMLCECKCVQRDILSCPLTCQIGRPLN
ncbi:uncharacterized protein LOC134801776 [Cydia splendana]|uniref:uncharacterized protein LOC134801776 n=1 Tax=Cydia splendana TaxID=1100963 RepID=UPI0028F4C210